MGKPCSGQVTLPKVSRRQCRCAAKASNVGLHIAAWESPTNATVLVAAGSPDTHSDCPTSRQERTQPLRNTSGLSAGASASDGDRFDGTACSPTESATADCTWATTCCTAESYGSPATTGELGVFTATAGAAAPCPVGIGLNMRSTKTTATAAPVMTPPRARLRFAERRRGPANLAGFSTSTSVTAAKTPEIAAADNRSPSPKGWPIREGASSSTGQCHRYHE